MVNTFKLVTYILCFCILITFFIFVMLGIGKIELSDIAISTLGGVTIALMNLMKVLFKQFKHGAPRSN